MSTSSATRRRILSVASHVRVLIIDDEWSIRELLEDFLSDHLPGANIKSVGTAAEARERLEESPFDIVFTDLGLPDLDGRELVAQLVESYPELTVIVITSRCDIEDAVNMFRQGVYDYITKPVDLGHVGVSVDRAIDRLNLSRENQLLRQGNAIRGMLPGIVSESASMLELTRQIRLIAPRDTSVLIEGESGTGKELVARAIHALSPRAKGPFIAVNVAAIPETLVEAEFFGYGKNSGVSGAPLGGRAGMFEAANGGTLFLDEIGDMPLQAQSKVLRSLQERELVRIGTTSPIPLDIRIVCATHHDLAQAVEEKSFREDLYFRLNSFPVYIPPLRDRTEDIAVLAQHFLDEFSSHEPVGSVRKVLAPDAIKVLQEMPWPGNVRELKSRVERIAITTVSDVIRAKDIDNRTTTRRNEPIMVSTPAPVRQEDIQSFEDATNKFEYAYLLSLLEVTGWNVTHAADKASLSRTYIHRLMKKHAINRPS